MPHDNIEPDSPKHWLRFAKADLAVARSPMTPDSLFEPLCFLAQQASEKSIKAVLRYFDIGFPYTHNIRLLVSLLPEESRRILESFNAEDLGVYAVTTRYPGDEDFITEEEFSSTLQIAEAVVAWAEAIINKS